MAKTDYKTIDDYHTVFPHSVRERMQIIRNIIHKIVPEAEEVISYQLPAFKMGKKFLIYYGAFAKHLTLSNPWSEALLTEFKKDLESLSVSKSAIQLPHNKELPVDFIERLLKFRKQEIEKVK